MKQFVQYLLISFLVMFFLFPSASSAFEEDNDGVVLDFYYSESCGTCDYFKQLITDNFKNNDSYNEMLTVNIKDVDSDQYYPEWRDEYNLYPYPFVVISTPFQQTDEIGEFEITISYLDDIIKEFYFNIDIIPVVNSSNRLTADLYYTSNCSVCSSIISSFTAIEQNFSTNFSFESKNIDVNQTFYQEFQDFNNQYNSSLSTPLVVFRNNNSIVTVVNEKNLSASAEYISNVLHEFVKKTNPRPTNDNIINTPFGPIDINAWSLPALTIILGGIDSFNPCAFFILIFLLNLLIYARSRRRMLLIGGIFIFFSGFLYMIFMFFMYELFRQLQTNSATLLLITIAVGAIVLPMGLLNIKDFFYFKKGASLSIPDSKKPKIYKKMRGLVKNPKLGATLIGTIVLAGTVNFYELLCTLGLPFAFTKALSNFSIANESATYYFYILLYNIVYVIPLFIIVLIFVVTLGKRKLSEWHGQVMKLVSGIMLTSFGIIFLTNYKLLENVLTPILLLLISIGSTAVIAFFYKKYVGIPSESDSDESS